ncbi:MAG: DUF1614 domain-containing protein [Calditrichaeota bacterium]|nr:DUF1614 domain-containing protein [Calditrichota bacterium]
MFFAPFIILVLLIYFLILIGLIVFVEVGAIAYVFDKIGVAEGYVFSLLFLTLIGSFINIPIKRIQSGELEPSGQVVQFWGYRFVIPAAPRPRETLLAINVGGALIPSLLALYLMVAHPGLLFKDLMAIAIVVLVVHRFARPVRGVGITTPAFLPPLIAASCALILAPAHSPIVAYVSGTLGTLIGADLLNLKKISELGAPVASIGGAGTFDGVFLTGIIAVLLATW